MVSQFDPHVFDDLIAAACADAQIAIPLVRADIQHESSWNALAVGDGGAALGLMQVHRIAAEDVGMAADWDALKAAIDAQDQTTAATLGLQIGTAYLAKMLMEFGGSEAWGLAAYNQGPTVVRAFRLAQRYAETVIALKGVA